MPAPDIVPISAIVSDIASTGIVLLLGLWFVATIMNSFEPTKDPLTAVLGDFSTLVPGWRFFAPLPGQVDYSLYYRDKQVDGSTTPWRRVERFTSTERKWHHFVWNPSIYANKALFDIVENLASDIYEENLSEEEIDQLEQEGDVSPEDQPSSDEFQMKTIDLDERMGSVLYLTLLEAVTQEDHSNLSEATQFAIMVNSRDLDNYEPVFVSKFHKLEE